MAQGRKTGGRKRGTPNKKTAERLEQIRATGKDPLDVMLANMRWADERAAELLAELHALDRSEDARALDLFRDVLRFRELAQSCARDAAPYVHPKLAQIAKAGFDGGPIVRRITVQVVGSPNAAIPKLEPLEIQPSALQSP